MNWDAVIKTLEAEAVTRAADADKFKQTHPGYATAVGGASVILVSLALAFKAGLEAEHTNNADGARTVLGWPPIGGSTK